MTTLLKTSTCVRIYLILRANNVLVVLGNVFVLLFEKYCWDQPFL